jgi:hypothetical protein
MEANLGSFVKFRGQTGLTLWAIYWLQCLEVIWVQYSDKRATERTKEANKEAKAAIARSQQR